MLTAEESERAVEILRDLQRTEWQRWVHGSYDALQAIMQCPDWPRGVTFGNLLEYVPVTRLLGDGPMPELSYSSDGLLQPMALTEQEAQRAVEILRELDMTEYQRYMLGLRRAAAAESDGGAPSISYHDALVEAKEHRKRDPQYKSVGQILREKPDEVARQKRLDDERREAQAAMMREYEENGATPQEQIARPVVEPEATRPVERITPSPSNRPRFNNVMDALTAPEQREPRCLNEDSAMWERMERW
jgi:hypothetical protein